MPDPAKLRMDNNKTAPVVLASSRSTGVHLGADAGVGVVRSAGEYCLVAMRAIAAGQQIFRIEGDVTPRPSRYSVQIAYQLHIDLRDDITMEEILDRYFWRFMNHSCEPSALVREREVIAARGIAPWEPITFNYNTTEWEMAERFTCRCASVRCLGQIQGFRYLSALQRAQLGPVASHLSRYLSEATRR